MEGISAPIRPGNENEMRTNLGTFLILSRSCNVIVLFILLPILLSNSLYLVILY